MTTDRSAVKFCKTTHSPGNQVKFQNYLDRLQESKIADNSETIHLNVVYVVIPIDPEGNISNARIQAQHSLLNLHLNKYQVSDLVPDGNARYPYDNIWGDPNVQLYPIDATQVTEAHGYVIRLASPTSYPLNGYEEPDQPMNEFLKQGYKVTPGTVYIFISTLESDSSGSLLGMAQDIIANYMMVHYGTVGSDTLPGTFAEQKSMKPFSYGKTLLHELGHCFGLWHPFSGTACGDATTNFIAGQNPQSPMQINPNFGGLEKVSNITTGACSGLAMDNRARDFLRISNPNCNPASDSCCGLKPGDSSSAAAYSCASTNELKIATTPFETVMMFMDYAEDNDRIGFPSATVAAMRSVLLNYPELFTVNANTVSETPATTTVVTPVPATTATPTTASILTPAVIAAIVIGSILAVFLLFFMGRYLIQHKRGAAHTTVVKAAAAYRVAEQRKYYV